LVEKEDTTMKALYIAGTENGWKDAEELTRQGGLDLVRCSELPDGFRDLPDGPFVFILIEQVGPLNGSNCLTSAEILRRNPAFRHTPILFLLEAGKPVDISFDGHASGPVDILIKPIMPTLFENKLRWTLNFHDQKQELERLRGIEEDMIGMEKEVERVHRLYTESVIENIESGQVLNSSTGGMWVIDKEHRVVMVNDTMAGIIGKTRDQIRGRTCHDLFPGPLCNTPDCAMNRIVKMNQSVKEDVEVVTPGCGLRSFILTAVPFYGIDGRLFGIVEDFKDITERRRAEKDLEKSNRELEKLAIVDALTQVANRREFDERLRVEWNRLTRDKKPLSLIMCDIDWFKQYNDTYGHQEGDACLREVAGMLESHTRRPADLLARYGGEEFAVILPDTDAPGAMMVAEKMRRAVHSMRRVHKESGISPYLTISIGVSSIVPTRNLSPEHLVRSSDRALYAAKEHGRNRCAYRESL
jgi:diguanylate cyclase (GGDEF)-like protein/PAS domain S-box-containing protein